MPLTITVRNNGPYAVDLTTGSLKLVDHEGNEIPIPEGKERITLCRCGASTRKPFCDGTHSKIGFRGAEQARAEHDTVQQGDGGGTSVAQQPSPSEPPASGKHGDPLMPPRDQESKG
jgi:CDGSH-type Zn-finger protein